MIDGMVPPEENRRILAPAAVPMVLPYSQQAGLTALFILPVGWLPVVLGELGNPLP
jgi:hypothetical protein